MQLHRIPLRSWFSWHRYPLAVAIALVLVALAFLAVAPMLAVVAAVEWKYRHRRLLGLLLLVVLFRAVVWLWLELRGLPHGRWQPCVQCGAPIEEPSRASYCSPSCRRLARLERDAGSPDPWVAERAAARLAALARLQPTSDPALAEIPF
jgi:hypothetical protein